MGENMCLDLGKNRGINQAGQEDNKKKTHKAIKEAHRTTKSKTGKDSKQRNK